MGNPVGFMLHAREDAAKRPVAERVRDFREVEQRLGADRLETQASRCMDCGIPYLPRLRLPGEGARAGLERDGPSAPVAQGAGPAALGQ